MNLYLLQSVVGHNNDVQSSMIMELPQNLGFIEMVTGDSTSGILYDKEEDIVSYCKPFEVESVFEWCKLTKIGEL